MQLIRNRLKRIDIYSTARVVDEYIGTKAAPVLLGYVYADIQHLPDELNCENGGNTIKRRAKLYCRRDAGVQCGDLAAVYSKKPDCRVTSIKRTGDCLIATVEQV